MSIKRFAIICSILVFASLGLSCIAFVDGYSLGYSDGYVIGLRQPGRTECLASANRRHHETPNSSSSDSVRHSTRGTVPSSNNCRRACELVRVRMDNGKTRHYGEWQKVQSPRNDSGELRLSAWHSSGSHQHSERASHEGYGYRSRPAKTTRPSARSKRSSGDGSRLPSGRDGHHSRKGLSTTPYHY